MTIETAPYDAVLIVSFGGPEGRDEVMPFLENVLRGRNVPQARMLEVAEHYQHFGGVSPINAQNRELIAAVQAEFAATGLKLPVYFGNRNWHPMLADTLRRMRAEGVITRQTTILDPDALGLEACFFVLIRTSEHEADWQRRFLTALRERPEVMEAHRLA
ncbi:hypothetical protein HC776_03755, partial [bacterium]|nr:hypothetical protein [bacterium]